MDNFVQGIARKQVLAIIVADKCGYPLAVYFGVRSSCSKRTHSHRPDKRKMEITVITLRTIQNRYVLVKIGKYINRRYRLGLVT